MSLQRTMAGMLLLFFYSTTFSSPLTYDQVLQFSYAPFSTEPSNLRGGQLFLQWQQRDLCWRQFQLIFDIGLSRFDHPHPDYNELTIVSASPLLRYHFKALSEYQLFLDVSIGISYLNRTQIDSRNLGMHFAFQDRIGLGIIFGDTNQYSVGIHMVHYSNASLSKHNDGISIPAVLSFSIKI